MVQEFSGIASARLWGDLTMTVMQIRCDRCGEISETGRHKLTLQCEPRSAISSRDFATSDPTINLCKPCFDDLHEWFAEALIYVDSSFAAAGGSMDRSAVAVQTAQAQR